MVRRTRQEVISVGFDDLAELTTPNPYATGLRVPPLVGVTYRFLACVADLAAGDEVVGLRQFAEIAEYELETGDSPPPAPVYAERRPIVTSGWHFADTAPMTWTVTFERLANFWRSPGPFDQTSFQQYDTTGPALVYESAAFPVFPTLPGYLGLSAYAPPAIHGIVQDELKDIRFPIQQNEFFAIRRPIVGPMRVRVYVDVQQTNPSTRFVPSLRTSLTAQQLFFVGGAMSPEEQFLQAFPAAIVHSVGAALIFDRNSERVFS
jgi:hypothetical protein